MFLIGFRSFSRKYGRISNGALEKSKGALEKPKGALEKSEGAQKLVCTTLPTSFYELSIPSEVPQPTAGDCHCQP